MARPLFRLLSLLILLPSMSWAAGFLYQSESSNFSGCRTRVEADDGATVDFDLDQNLKSDCSGSIRMSLATGMAARSLRSATSDKRPDAPQAPRMIELRNAKGAIWGGLTEILPGTNIYVTARHVLQRSSVKLLGAAFEPFLGSLANVGAIEFHDGYGRVVDLILVGPQNRMDELLANGFGEMADQLADQVNLNDHYSSYQFGSVGASATYQFSKGDVNRFDEDGNVILSPGDTNLTTRGSSGALVYFSSSERSREPGGGWRAGAVISCFLRQTESNGVPTEPGVRTVALRSLLTSYARGISLRTLSKEPRKQPAADCEPIDRRDAGGL